MSRSPLPRAPRTLTILVALPLLWLAGCGGDDDPAGPGGGDSQPRRLVAPLENAVVGVPLVANQPTTIDLTLQLPPDLPLIESAEIDVAGTLDHVTIDNVPLWKLIARKVAHLAGKADDLGATATIRVGSDPSTVCETGILYGPFAVSHGTSLVVEPATATADEATLQVINLGLMTLCLTVTANFDCTLSVDAVAMDIREGRCAAPADFAGTWTGTYECGNWCLQPFGGDIEMTVTQNGTDASYVDDGGDAFAGVVCGNMFRFEYTGDDFRERGTLTLNEDGTATKRSTWRSLTEPYCGGDCTDQLTRVDHGDCPALSITTASLPAAHVGQPYSAQVTTSGGSGTVTRWLLPVNPIPGLEGLTNGLLAGTPTAEAVGQWEVRATVYDQCTPDAQVEYRTFMLTVTE